MQLFVCMHLCSRSFNEKLKHMYIDCKSIYSSCTAEKQTGETRRKINSSGTFDLSLFFFIQSCRHRLKMSTFSDHLSQTVVNRSLSNFSLQQTSAKPYGALDILTAVNASQ